MIDGMKHKRANEVWSINLNNDKSERVSIPCALPPPNELYALSPTPRSRFIGTAIPRILFNFYVEFGDQADSGVSCQR